MMIDSIHARLIHWSESVKGNIGLGYVGSPLGKIASGAHVSPQRTSIYPDVDATAYDTEKAVQRLPEALKAIVVEFYINDTNTIEQKLKALNISKRTLYRRLDNAQALIQEYLR